MSLKVKSAATISPVSASPPRCSFRQDRRVQDRRVRAPCFSTSHSPGPQSRRPVLSTRQCTGSRLDRGGSIGSVSARRLNVEWSGTARSRPQRQSKHGAQGQCRRDRQSGVVRLPAPRGPWSGAPSRDRRVRKPDRQAAALAQGSIMLRPIRDQVPPLWNMMAAIGIHLEWQGKGSRACEGPALLPLLDPRPNRPIHATR
jgi:hypothetical protein